MVAQNNQFDYKDKKIIEKVTIGTYYIDIPLHFTIEDDDNGKFSSCLEIPQLYGVGDTIQDALDMLDREIISLYADLCEDYPISHEYQLLKLFLESFLQHKN